MKDATFYLLSEFYRLLGNSISVPFYNIEQDTDATAVEWVKSASTNQLPDKTKDKFQGEYFINLDVVTIVADNAASVERLNTISNEVLSIICPTPTTTNFNNSIDFQVIDVTLEAITDLPELRQNTNFLMRKVLQFKIMVSQK